MTPTHSPSTPRPQDIQIADYDYTLPDERIAKYPLEQRDSSKLMVVNGSHITDSSFSCLPSFLPEGATLVFNNTKVIQARLLFHKSTGALIEIFLLEPFAPHDYQLALLSTHHSDWKCLIGNSKKWKDGHLERTIPLNSDGSLFAILRVERLASEDETPTIRLSWSTSDASSITLSELLEQVGELPIPPYLNRSTEESDKERYQTLYSKIEGSVAAPTAGLHFTEKVLEELTLRGIQHRELTLHVGAGTFRPVKTNTLADHSMHQEFVAVPLSLIEHLLTTTTPTIAVGTTSVRTLESLYYIGRSLIHTPLTEPTLLQVEQWEPYEKDSSSPSTIDALQAIAHYLHTTKQTTLLAETRIMIVPSFRFRIVNSIITNFHQPQSTLLLLVSAFVGEKHGNPIWHTLYDHALNNNYRFLSYGDSSLLMKAIHHETNDMENK